MTDNPVTCNPIIMIILTTVTYCVVKIIALMYIKSQVWSMYVQAYHQYGKDHPQTKQYGDRSDFLVDRIDNFTYLMLFCNGVYCGWLFFVS